MTARPYLRTHDLALAGHISVQQSTQLRGEWLDPASTVLHPGESMKQA